MARNHYGVTVDKSIPIGGVIHNTNQACYLIDEIMEGIDLDFENHINDCGKCIYDLYCETMEHWDYSQSTVLVGDWIFDTKTKEYSPDENGENGYSAISSEIYTQIVWSRFVSQSKLCSPCYPGQGDIANQGHYLTYDLPPDVYGDWLTHEITELMEV